jgi:hypothetical protein
MSINIFGRMHQRKYENETFPFSDIIQTKELFLGPKCCIICIRNEKKKCLEKNNQFFFRRNNSWERINIKIFRKRNLILFRRKHKKGLKTMTIKSIIARKSKLVDSWSFIHSKSNQIKSNDFPFKSTKLPNAHLPWALAIRNRKKPFLNFGCLPLPQ